MLRHRFKYDGIATEPMNRNQSETKATVEKKIVDGVYKFENKDCRFCHGDNFELLAEKDRYGLYAPVKICRDCGLLQLTPRMTRESYNEFYACEYRRLYGSDNISRERFFAQQQENGDYIYGLLSNCKFLKTPPETALILEVGCGAGGILKPFKDHGYRVKGIDLGPEYLEYGRNTYDLDLEQGDLDSLRLSQPPDVVIYNHVFEHLPEPMEELRKLRLIMPDGGLLFIEVPGVKKIAENKRYRGDFLAYLQNAHICHFSARTLGNMLYRSGFKIRYICDDLLAIAFKGEVDETKIENDYAEVMEYLHNLEKIKYLSEKAAAGK